MNPRVQDAIPTDDYKLRLVFTNGETGVFDCSELLDFGVFEELRDLSYFKKARVEYGTVTWPHEQDICPDTLYLDSEPHSRAPIGSPRSDPVGQPRVPHRPASRKLSGPGGSDEVSRVAHEHTT